VTIRPEVSAMHEGEADQFGGKLVRVRLQRGVMKVLVGVFLGEDSETI